MVSCPTCEESFVNERGMKIHHSKIHGESIAGVETVCSWCSSTIRRQKDRASGDSFCDDVCYGEWLSRNKTGEKNPNWSGGNEDVVCQNCGEEFEKIPANVSDLNFCCEGCRTEWISNNWVGENHPAWTGGSSQYLDGWHKRRKEVRERDDYQCQNCGVEQSEHEEEHGMKLHVHHKTPRKEFDDVKTADRDDNLVTLCTSCHARVENRKQ
jgi:5-methylcytosine-specific restriction endonuclease McrA